MLQVTNFYNLELHLRVADSSDHACSPGRGVDISQQRRIKQFGNVEGRERRFDTNTPPSPEVGEDKENRYDLDCCGAGEPS